MSQSDPRPIRPPNLAAPTPLVERRQRSRRAADQLVNDERHLLARALDILARAAPAPERLADLLGLVARVAGARRSAVLAEGLDRRVAVAIGPHEDPAAGRALSGWLDANAPRSLAERAAALPAPVAVVRMRANLADGATMDWSGDRDPGPAASAPGSRTSGGATGSGGATARHDGEADPATPASFALVEVPGVERVYLGFELSAPADPGEVAARFPGALARHAAVALALVTAQVADESELKGLRAAERERDQYVSTVAHELRTPLTGLRGYLDLIVDGKVADQAVVREFLERSQVIVESLGALVGDLLDRAKLEAGSLRLEIGAFSVADACSKVLDGLEPIAGARGLHVVAELPPRIRTAVADRRRVEQIVTNLVANACKFAAPGGLVEVVARFTGSFAVVAVRDDGPGIAAEERARIFEPFVRLAGHERVVGTGLGLPIAQGLARATGGDIGVASLPGSGSAFVLVLPAVGASGDAWASEVMDEALAAALEEEELNLERRAVLAALRSAGRPRPQAEATSPVDN